MQKLVPKIVAYYLPQFHEIEENNQWWGRKFTEWTNLRKARPLFRGHNQPSLPKDGNFYDLTNKDTVIWQTGLAKDHCVDAFCYYHYWFQGRQLLQRPAENYLRWTDINHQFMFMWANHDWTRSWTGGKEILVKQEYGTKPDWVRHIRYLMKFFEDDRYIKIDNRPALEIYISKAIPELDNMLEVWHEECVLRGFPGLFLINKVESPIEKRDKRFSATIHQEHTNSLAYMKNNSSIFRRVVRNLGERATYPECMIRGGPRVISYDFVVSNAIRFLETAIDSHIIPNVCTGWDNTPRYGRKGYLVAGATPEKFGRYLASALRLGSAAQSKFVFLSCWNEWCEGLVLEPTEQFGTGYLRAVRAAVESLR